MDPIATVNKKKDSTLAMLWEAFARGYTIYYMEQRDLLLRDSVPYANAKILQFNCEGNDWYEFKKEERIKLSDLDVILMRKDPPFNDEYVYTTYILEAAENLGTLVVNKPSSLRDANEKVFTTNFPECCVPTLIAQTNNELHGFLAEQKDIVCKPLNSMGGESIFRIKAGDINANVIFDLLTHHEQVSIVAQTFIPDVVNGDKRILMIDGKAVPHALARIPQKGDWRGNLAVGAKGIVQPLTKRDEWIVEQVGPELAKRGLMFVGIDIIGDYLTEVNVTSPTCIREIDDGASTDIAGDLFNAIESKIKIKRETKCKENLKS